MTPEELFKGIKPQPMTMEERTGEAIRMLANMGVRFSASAEDHVRRCMQWVQEGAVAEEREAIAIELELLPCCGAAPFCGPSWHDDQCCPRNWAVKIRARQ